MKPVYTILYLLLAGLHLAAQENILPGPQSHRSDIFILDSLYHWEWDDTDLSWVLNDRTRYGYDINQNVDREISYELDSSLQWTPLEYTLSDYDESNLLYQLMHQWNGITWDKVSFDTYTYDVNKDRTAILYQTWNDTGWVNSFQQLFTFDNNHNILTRISQYWNGSDWNYNQRQEIIYDNNLPVIRLFQGWDGTSWYDISRSLSTYDINNDLDTLLYQKYLFNGWTDDYRNIYDYDSNHNRTLILEQLALGIGVWENKDKYEYTYDSHEKITHLVNSIFVNDAWQYNYQYNVTNDDDHNRVTEVFQTWENDWLNQDSTQYYYTNLTGVKEIVEPHSMSFSPNPTNDQLNIEFEKEFDGRMSVYNMQGSLMMEKRSFAGNIARLDVADWLPGQYILVLRSGNSVTAKAFQKL